MSPEPCCSSIPGSEALFSPGAIRTRSAGPAKGRNPRTRTSGRWNRLRLRLPVEKLEEQLRARPEHSPRLFTLTASEQKDGGSGAIAAKLLNAAPDITKLRIRKSPGELALNSPVDRCTIAAHRGRLETGRAGPVRVPGLPPPWAGSVSGPGLRAAAYAPIVGSGPNSTVAPLLEELAAHGPR